MFVDRKRTWLNMGVMSSRRLVYSSVVSSGIDHFHQLESHSGFIAQMVVIPFYTTYHMNYHINKREGTKQHLRKPRSNG